ncbi:unnamed protein product [Amoebophrya sp. A120]|nr:unnamed protein product [Amoebophrya sp. A120]|eukprot:GSA120T00003955001.1
MLSAAMHENIPHRKCSACWRFFPRSRTCSLLLLLLNFYTALHFQRCQATHINETVVTSALPRRPLRVAMIPFTWMPWAKYDAEKGVYTEGFLPDFWRALSSLPCDIRPKGVPCFDIQFVTIPNTPEYFADPSAFTRQMVLSNQVDVGFDSNDHFYADQLAYTQPMVLNWTVGILKKKKVSVGLWQIFAPFTTELWVALLLSILFGAFVLQLLSLISSSTQVSVKNFAESLYHTTAALLGGDEYDLYHVSPLGRLYRTGLLFLILITSATYTANLAAFLTKPAISVQGPKTLTDLKDATACARHRAITKLGDFVGDLKFPPVGMAVTDTVKWAQDMLESGQCDVIVENDANARTEMLENCERFHVEENLQFLPSYTYNIVRKEDTQLATWISEATIVLMGHPLYAQILQSNMKLGRTCDDQMEVDDTTPINVEQMGGMFVIFGATGVVAVLVTIADRCHRRKPRKPEDFEEDVRTSLEKLEESMAALQERVAKIGSAGAAVRTLPSADGDASAAIAMQDQDQDEDNYGRSSSKNVVYPPGGPLAVGQLQPSRSPTTTTGAGSASASQVAPPPFGAMALAPPRGYVGVDDGEVLDPDQHLDVEVLPTSAMPRETPKRVRAEKEWLNW